MGSYVGVLRNSILFLIKAETLFVETITFTDGRLHGGKDALQGIDTADLDNV